MTERTLPEQVRQGYEASASGDADLIFVTITHPNLDSTIRLVTDGEDYVIDGLTYYKGGFDLEILSDDDGPPVSKFGFPNVDRKATMMLHKVNGPATVSFEVYSSSWFDLTASPRTVKPGVTIAATYSASNLFLTDITITPSSVNGTLRSWDYRQESWPNMMATQTLLPGVWAA